jgi:hypothetical protein
MPRPLIVVVISLSLCLPVSLSPCLPVSLSPSLPVSLSPGLPVSLSPSLPVSLSPCLPVSLSPSLPVSLSPCLPVSLSPCLPVSLSPCLPVSLSPCLPVSRSPGLAVYSPNPATVLLASLFTLLPTHCASQKRDAVMRLSESEQKAAAIATEMAALEKVCSGAWGVVPSRETIPSSRSACDVLTLLSSVFHVSPVADGALSCLGLLSVRIDKQLVCRVTPVGGNLFVL